MTQTYTIPCMADIYSKESFEAHIKRISDDLWGMYHQPARTIEIEEPDMTIEEELATLQGEELDEFIAECWTGDIPEIVMETWASRRSRRLEEAWKQAEAEFERAAEITDEAHWLLWESLPEGSKGDVSRDGHLAKLYAWCDELARVADAARTAYEGR